MTTHSKHENQLTEHTVTRIRRERAERMMERGVSYHQPEKSEMRERIEMIFCIAGAIALPFALYGILLFVWFMAG